MSQYPPYETCNLGHIHPLPGFEKSDWISVKDKEPPSEGEFLGFDGEEIYMVECSKRYGYPGWLIVKSNCSCCNGYCGIVLTHWMPLTEPPKKLVQGVLK